MKCANCGETNPAGMKFCGFCGAALPTDKPDVTCPNCGHGNRATSRFCAECGANLPAPGESQCPNCGHTNRATAIFCAECGNKLPSVNVLPIGSQPLFDERRIVTIIFGDIAGFTAMAEQLDPEEVKVISNECLTKLAEEVKRFDGTVDKYLGDNIMVLFGAPVAHEDDPERAVRCALEMQRAIKSLSQALVAQRGPQFALELHIGINTGEVMAGIMGGENKKEHYTVMGDAVNLASRLQHAAEVGKIMVGEQTYRATREIVEYREIEPLKVRGKQLPVPAWEVMRLKVQRDRERSNVGLEAPMIGRDQLFSNLKRLFAEVLEQQRTELVVVYSAAGMGKSRFLLEFEKYAEGLPQHVCFRKGRSLPYGEGVSYWALGEIIKAECGILDDDPPDVLAHRIDQRVRQLYAHDIPANAEGRKQVEAKIQDVIHGLSFLLLDTGGAGDAVEAQNRKDTLFSALREFFRRMAQQSPLVLAFEDTHWADEGLLEFITYLAETASDAPILLIALARPQLKDKRANWDGYVQERHNVIVLTKLDEQVSGVVLDELLKGAGLPLLPANVRKTITDTAEGNPFFLEETVRMLLDGGALQAVASGAEIEEIRIPDTIQALVGARIDRLGQRPDGSEDPAGLLEKRALQAAAVVGRVFWRGAVARLLDEQSDVDAALRALQDKDFIYERAGSRFTREREYSFRSILTRDVAYNTLPMKRRGEEHGRVAVWIEQKAGGRSAEFCELLAHHYEQAALLSIEVLSLAGGTVNTAMVGKAIHYLQEAADRERARQNIRAAIALYERAIDLIERSKSQPDVYLSLFCAHAAILEVQGQYDQALTELGKVMTMAQQKGKVSDHARAMVQTADVYHVLGRLDEAERLATAGLASYQQAKDNAGEAEALRVLGKVALAVDQMSKGQNYFQRLFSLCVQMGDVSGQASALYQLGEVSYYNNDPKRCIYFVQEAQHKFSSLGDKRQVAYCMHQLGAVYTDLAEYQRAEGYEKQARDLLAGLGDRLGVANTVTSLARIHGLQRRLDEARREIGQSVAAAREIGSSAAIAWSLRVMGQIYSAAGEWDKAAQAYSDAFNVTHEFKLTNLRAELYRGMAEVEMGRGNPDAALSYTEQGLGGLPEDDYYANASLLRVRGQALAAKGETAVADQALTQSIAILEQQEYPADLALSYRAYADFLTAQSDAASAFEWRAKADAVMNEASIRDSSESLTQMLPQVVRAEAAA